MAQAFIIGEKFIGNDSACLVLGDNIFYGAGFTKLLHNAVNDADQNGKATVFGYWVLDPERYSVAEFDREGNCLSIEEKPKVPKSNYAVVGLYFYPNKVVDVAKHIKPSARGELEITTVNQEFLKEGELKVQVFGRGFAWLDTGTHDSLAEASTFVEVIEKRQGLKVACLEGIAYRNGWISEERMREIAQPMQKNQYGQYLLKVIDEMKENKQRNVRACLKYSSYDFYRIEMNIKESSPNSLSTGAVKAAPKPRCSNLELYRIICMLMIVAHHYIVNSGVSSVGAPLMTDFTSSKSIFFDIIWSVG